MSAAFLQVFTDSAHTSEVAHTTQNSTTTNTGSTLAAGATSVTLSSTTGMPTQGVIDIIDGTNGNETIPYYGLSGNVIQLANATAHQHPNGTTVNQWLYVLAVGDQTNGIPNDGTNAGPNSPTNVGTWYLYNSGGQTAQSITIATNSGAPSTTQGFADTLVSITSASAGFSASVSPANIASAASAVQFWVVAEIPSGQSAVGNPQLCIINITYGSI